MALQGERQGTVLIMAKKLGSLTFWIFPILLALIPEGRLT